MTVDPLLRVPRQVPNVDIRRLPIGPEEAYVMSRVDGVSTIREIAYSTGFSFDQVERCVVTLERLGAVLVANSSNSSQVLPAGTESQVLAHASTTEATKRISSEQRISPTPQGPPRPSSPEQVCQPSPREPAPSAWARGNYDEAQLLEECELDIERKRTILGLFSQLDQLDHYRLLGLTPDADRKAVKSAYYRHVTVMHPDRYFGKNLGSYRTKLERCFARLTEAYETLADSVRRQEYDDYLKSVRDTSVLEESLSQDVTAADIEALAERLAATFSRPTDPPPSRPETIAPPPPEPAAAVILPSAPLSELGPIAPSIPVEGSLRPSGRPLSDEERKRALARKLHLSQPNLRIPSQAPVAATGSVPPKEHIAEQLKRQYARVRNYSQQGLLVNLLKEADVAMASGDPVRASSALRNAQSIAPEDGAIAERLSSAQSLASLALCDTYLKQAEYEEKSGRWEAAARSYERVARGRPSPEIWEAAARCLLEANGDLRVAGDYARKAIALNPERASSHLLLARIFLGAKMRASALSELERARSLDPNNDTVLSLLARMKSEKT